MAEPRPSPRLLEFWFTASLLAFIVVFGLLLVYVGEGSVELTPFPLILVTGILVDLLMARWIYLDARRRGMDGRSWGRYALWFPLFTWVIYLIKRRQTPVQAPVP